MLKCARLPQMLLACVLSICIADLVAAQQNTQPIDAYFASRIWPGDGPAIADGVLLVQGSKILAVGSASEVDVPEDAVRHDLSGQTLVPGLVIAQTALLNSTSDSEYAITPSVRAIDGFDPFDDYDKLIASGITTVQLSPGSGRLMPGQGAVVKLGGEDPTNQVLREVESLRIVLTQNALSPPTIYEPPVGAVSVDRPLEPTRPQLATSLAQAIVGLDALLTAAKAENLEAEYLDALATVLEKRLTVRFTVDNAAEVNAAVELARKFGLKWMLVDPGETGPLANVDWSDDASVGVLLSPEFRAGRITNPSPPVPGREPPSDVWERARELVDAGASKKLAIHATTDADLNNIFFLAGVFGRGGLSTEQILRMLTANPARMLGVEERVGMLQPGADADFVVLSGQPFSSDARVLATYLNGEQAYSAKVKESAYVVSASRVYTPAGMIEGGVSVSDGKITGVGKHLSTPRGATLKDFGDAVIVPGLLDCQTVLGIGGTLGDQLPLNTKLGDLLARDDEQIARARQGGVTAALLSSSRLPSPVIAFKLSDQPRPLMDPVALRFGISGNLTAAEESLRRTLQSGKAYSAAWDKYDAEYAEYEKKLKEYEAAKQKYDAAVKAKEEAAKKEAAKKAADAKAEGDKSDDKKEDASSEAEKKDDEKNDADKKDPEKKDPGKEPEKSDEKNDGDSKPQDGKAKTDGAKTESKESSELKEPKKPDAPKKPTANAGLEPYRDLFHKKIAALVDLDDPKAFDVAIQLFRKEFDLRTAIVVDEPLMADVEALAKSDVMVIVGPNLIGERDGETVNFPADLSVAGVELAFQSKSSTGASILPDAVAFAVFEGLGRDDAVKAMSGGPAEFFNLKTIGNIEVGRDADLVVLSGPPFAISSQVLAVMIDGKWVYEKESK